ncbi:MAG: HAD family hydrolase [Pseudomonadota bacterium]
MATNASVNWDNIDTVLLDMDGTLLDLNFDNYFWMTHLPKRYCDIHGGDRDQVRMQLLERIMSERGSQRWYDLTYWSDSLEVDICALKCEVQHLIRPLTYTDRFLKAATRAGKKLYIVTNAHESSVEIKLGRVDFSHYFERIVVAFEYDEPKEADAFWTHLKNDLDYDPARTLFADDNPDVLAAAERAGIAEVIGMRCPDSVGTRHPLTGHKAVDHLGFLIP